MTVIVLARHAQTASNAANKISTQAPGCGLTNAGRAQAAQLGRILAARRPAAIYSSHLVRAVETAAVLAHAASVTARIEEDLREIDAGDLDGRHDAEAYAVLDDVLARWAHGDLDARIGPSGEDGHRLIGRIRALLTSWARDYPGETVVAVTHGGLIQIAVPHLALNLRVAHRHGEHLPNGATVELAVTGDGAITCLTWAGEPITSSKDRREGKDA